MMLQTNLDLFDSESISDIDYSKPSALTDIGYSEAAPTPSLVVLTETPASAIADIGYSENKPPACTDAVEPAAAQPEETAQPAPAVIPKTRARKAPPPVTGDRWCNVVLEQAIALKTDLKELRQNQPEILVEILDAIAYVARCKRDAYAGAHQSASEGAEALFGWQIKRPVLARHVALLNSKNVDLNLIPMLPASEGA